ncbi:polymeric immunoglobulin receptor-like, partial [Silurus asotus]
EKSISKSVHVGGDLNISCKYPQSLRNYPKFLCKGLQPAACIYKESVTESRKDVNVGKFSLYDDRTEQIFTVSIRNVNEQDSGEYWCGAEAAWTSDHGYKVYFTQISLTVTDGGASKEVTGYSGGEVLIKCKYDAEYTQNLKYFCKGSWPGCSDLIKTGDKNMWVTSGRFSLFDDTKSAEFRVMIREITVEDTGTYQCGVDISWGKDIYTPVELKVKEDGGASKEVTGYSGGGVLIKCNYDTEYTQNLKYFCKDSWPHCSYQIKTGAKNMWVTSGRFSLFDDTKSAEFSVMIREITVEDTGMYQCGVDKYLVKDNFTPVELKVKE